MPRPQKRPDYNSNIIMKDLLDAVSEYYCSSDDKNGAKVSLHDVADEFGFTHMKARKLLITAGVYHTDLSDQVNELKRRGKTIQQIMEAPV